MKNSLILFFTTSLFSTILFGQITRPPVNSESTGEGTGNTTGEVKYASKGEQKEAGNNLMLFFVFYRMGKQA